MFGEPVWLAPRRRRTAFALRLLAFGVAHVSGAVLAGAGAAWLGASLLPEPWTDEGVPAYVVLVLLGLALWVAVRELRGDRRGIPQLAWQVPRHWLRRFWIGALAFGAIMGMGLFTRQVSLLFHLYLLGAFLTMSPLSGAVVGAVFGLTYFGGLLYATIAWRHVEDGGQDELLTRLGRRVQFVAAVAAPSIALIPAA